MKILIATDTYAPVVNGVVTSIRNLCASLTVLGHEVRILTLAPEAERSYESDGVYYLRSFRCAVYPTARMTIAFRDPLLREIEEWGPEVIHSQTEFTAFFCAKHLARRMDIPLVHTYHTLYEDYTSYFSPNRTLGVQIVRHLTRRVSRSVSLLCAPSVKVRDTLLSYRVEAPIAVLPTGIDLSRFGQALSDSERAAHKLSLGLPADCRLLVSVGRMAVEKNYDLLLRAAAPVLCAQADVHLLLVGDGPHRAALEAQARTLGIAHRVHFTGMVAAELVPAYYTLGDIFVCASTSETQGLTYLEAMASGLPQIVRRDDCLRGVIEDGINGLLFDTEAECTARLTTLLGDADTRRRMSEETRQRAERFGMDAFGAHALACYTALAQPSIAAYRTALCE